MIKNNIKSLIIGLALSVTSSLHAQVISDFEQLSIDSTGYWNGSDLSGGFQYGPAYFENAYDTTYSSWSGFSYSNLTDITTPGWMNQYSTFAGEGYEGSSNFVVASINTYATTRVNFFPSQTVQGFYITNSTYAALSMRDGDAIGKTFGADTLPNGSDTTYTGAQVSTSDWFKVSIYGVKSDTVDMNTMVEFYLADYQFADNSQDYIVDDWNWVDLTELGEIEALHFELASSDTGKWGMNTPRYFCMDNLVVGEIFSGEQEKLESLMSVYPNPANNTINLQVPFDEFNARILDNTGREVMSSNSKKIDISMLNVGVYFVIVEAEGAMVTKKLIKN